MSLLDDFVDLQLPDVIKYKRLNKISPFQSLNANRCVGTVPKLSDAESRMQLAAKVHFTKNTTPFNAACTYLEAINNILNTTSIANKKFDYKLAEASIENGIETNGDGALANAKEEMKRAVIAWMQKKEYKSSGLHKKYSVKCNEIKL